MAFEEQRILCKPSCTLDGWHCPLATQLGNLAGVPAVVGSCLKSPSPPCSCKQHASTHIFPSQAQIRKCSGEALDTNPFSFSDLKSYRNHSCILGPRKYHPLYFKVLFSWFYAFQTGSFQGYPPSCSLNGSSSPKKS